MRVRAAVACVLIAVHVSALADVSARLQYTGANPCAIVFQYPSNWKLVALAPAPDQTCRISLRPQDFESRMQELDIEELYTVEILVPRNGSFLRAAEASGFDFYQGSWVVRGRHGIHSEARALEGARWWGLQGTADVGCHREKGGYAGLCEQRRLLLHDEEGNISMMTGGSWTEEVFTMILETFTFTAPAAAIQ